MVRTFAIAAALGFAIAMPSGAGAKGKKVTPSDIPIVKHYDKASAARSGVDGETKEGHHSGTATQARDASTGLPSGKRGHRPVRAINSAPSKPAALTPAAPSPQPLPYPNSSK
jgi:hypothetical protein